MTTVAIGTMRDHAHPNAVPLYRDLRSRRAKFKMSDRWDQTVARGRGSRAFRQNWNRYRP
jgi:hypothetical protein